METKRLTVKNLKETIVDWCCGDPDEFERIRYMFDEMNRMGFISDYNLLMFEKETWGWKIDGNFLIDTADDDKVIFDFNNEFNRGNSEYRA